MAQALHSSALALFLTLGASPIWADVTPEDVWKNWQDGITAQGQTLSVGSQVREGDTLVIKGITLSTKDKAGAESKASFDEMRLKDNGDGTVAVILPDSLPLHLTLPPDSTKAGAKPLELLVNITTKGAKITASGVPDAVSYQSDVAEAKFATTIAQPDGKSTADLEGKFTDFSANDLISAGESGKSKSDTISAKSFDLIAKVKSSDASSDADIKFSLTDLAGKFDMTGMHDQGTTDLEQAMKDGLTVDATLSYGSGRLDVSGTDAGKPMTVKGGLGGGGFTLAMDAQKFHYDLSNKSISLDIAGTDTQGSEFTLTAALADFGSKLDIQGMVWGDTSDFGAALKAGLAMQGGLGIGTTSFDFSGADQGNQVKVKAGTGEVNVAFAMDKSQIHYATGSKALSMSVAAAGMPVPEVAMDLGEFAFDLALPVAKSDTPSPFTYVTRIVDLKLADAIWVMADPSGGLNHDPATLILDLKGTATLTQDLMTDAMNMESGATQAPGLLNSLDLNQFDLKALGAEITGLGSFTFDNSDTTTLPGMPLPTGKIDLTAKGLSALIDKAVELGLMQPEEAMQGRMMLAMFANTDAAKDEMTSTLEFKEGHFFANGQQLQ